MSFDDGSLRAMAGGGADTSGQTTHDATRYQGEGFRQEHDFRPQPADPMPENDSTLTIPRRVPPMPNLDYVFDDPADGEPGRDRMMVHTVWELVLAAAALVVGYLLFRATSTAFGGASLRIMLLQASFLGTLAVGSALALRAGAVNLAIGPAAAAAALYYGQHANDGLAGPISVVVGVCLVVGLVIGLLVVGLQVPGWAASLGAGLVLYLWSTRQAEVAVPVGSYDPGKHAIYWFAGFAALSVFGGLIGLVPAVRRAVGRFRPVGDPADRRGVVAALVTLLCIAGSTALGGVAGVLGAATTGAATPQDGLVYTALGLGAALLGGTSAFGRRGGVLGTVFAVILMTLVMAWATATHRTWSPIAIAAVAIGIGLAVTRVVEYFGRPGRDDDIADEDAWAQNTAPTLDNWTSGQSGWQTNGASTSDRLWGGAGGAWGTADRR
jgi:ribose/xylose/arabinose/galactoside ABC-type transport system permease subunit